MRARRAILATAVAIAICSTANATTITFDPLSGPNGDPYLGHVEGGFTVTPTSGDWRQAFLFGNPVPAIFGISDVGSIAVTDGLFTFTSVDLADATTVAAPTATFSIAGFLGGSSVLTLAGTTATSFTTFQSPNSTQTLDRLVITMNRGQATYNIDNIVVNRAVAEPGMLLLLGVGLTALAGTAAWRRRRAN